jgi:hypothetical protein
MVSKYNVVTPLERTCDSTFSYKRLPVPRPRHDADTARDRNNASEAYTSAPTVPTIVSPLTAM